jgi:hypothetical protein
MRLAIIGAAGRLGWCVAEEARALDHRPAQLAGQQAPGRPALRVDGAPQDRRADPR